jgi:GTP-binding protein HflX
MMTKQAFHTTESAGERCLLVGVVLPGHEREIIQSNLDELAALAATAGVQVSAIIIQERTRLDPAYYIGKGKASEIAETISEDPVDLIIFDDELSPAQIRNWENLTQLKILDRSALILDIFADHARSREARTQVELAQLNYLLPRLTGHWRHLSRQVGGVGTKGPGETQLETDRRLVNRRIAWLKKELDKIEKQRLTQGKKAQKVFHASLIGYTNAGKSTLLNMLTGADVHVADKLFATLDTTTRRLHVGGKTVLLSDTVGFIKKLPHHLIASFKSTLAQTQAADLLLHIVDLSDPFYADHMQVVSEIIAELEMEQKPLQIIFNKVDLVNDPALIEKARNNNPGALFISAKKKIRIGKIIESIEMKYSKMNL